jgi:hypothetical protein
MQPTTATETNYAEQQTNGAMSPSLLDDVVASSERRIALEIRQFEYKQKLARLFAASGCFADIKKDITEAQAIAQAFVKIELGESMGFTAAESMQGVHLIQGTPAVNAQLRAARMQRAGFSWEIDWFDSPEGVCEGCRLWLFRNGRPLMKAMRDATGNAVLDAKGQPVQVQVSVSFLKKDAEILKTTMWDNDTKQKKSVSVLEKDNWKGSPRNMYFARAITNAQRFHAAGVLSGEIPSTEEAMDFPDDFNEDHGRGSFEAQQKVLAEKLAEAAEWKAQQQPTKQPNESPRSEQGDVSEPQTVASESPKNPETPGWNDAPTIGQQPKPAAGKAVFGKRPA